MSPSSFRGGVRRMPVVGPLIELARRNTPVLTRTEVDQFNGYGFVVVDPGLPEATLDAAVAGALASEDIKKSRHHGSRVMNHWRECRAIKDIALAPRVLRMLRQLYGREPKPFQTLNFPTGTEQRAHSDTIHFASDPPGYMCGVWLALEDVDRANGALMYYPGSHKLKQVRMEDVAPGPGPKYVKLYEDYVEQQMRDSGIEPAFGILKKGQALIWASNLVHGGSAHADKARTRHSQVTHYYFEGCQYYMPLESYGGYRHLRFEDWIK